MVRLDNTAASASLVANKYTKGKKFGVFFGSFASEKHPKPLTIKRY